MECRLYPLSWLFWFQIIRLEWLGIPWSYPPRFLRNWFLVVLFCRFLFKILRRLFAVWNVRLVLRLSNLRVVLICDRRGFIGLGFCWLASICWFANPVLGVDFLVRHSLLFCGVLLVVIWTLLENSVSLENLSSIPLLSQLINTWGDESWLVMFFINTKFSIFLIEPHIFHGDIIHLSHLRIVFKQNMPTASYRRSFRMHYNICNLWAPRGSLRLLWILEFITTYLLVTVPVTFTLFWTIQINIDVDISCWGRYVSSLLANMDGWLKSRARSIDRACCNIISCFLLLLKFIYTRSRVNQMNIFHLVLKDTRQTSDWWLDSRVRSMSKDLALSNLLFCKNIMRFIGNINVSILLGICPKNISTFSRALVSSFNFSISRISFGSSHLELLWVLISQLQCSHFSRVIHVSWGSKLTWRIG